MKDSTKHDTPNPEGRDRYGKGALPIPGRRNLPPGIALLLASLPLILLCLFPFYWTVLSSFKPSGELLSGPLSYLPDRIDPHNYREVFLKRDFAAYIVNSLTVSGGGALLTLLISALLSFELLHSSRRVRALFERWLLVLALLPPTLLAIPLFALVRSLSLLNHPAGLILAYTLLNLPFGVWMSSAAFSSIPGALTEAARLDGFSRMGILFRIHVPLSVPALATAALLLFIFNWNEFLIALTFMSEEKSYTVPVGIALLSGSSLYDIPWGEIHAAVSATTLPLIVLVALTGKWILRGLLGGGIKG